MSVITCSYSEHNIRHLQNDDKGMTLLKSSVFWSSLPLLLVP